MISGMPRRRKRQRITRRAQHRAKIRRNRGGRPTVDGELLFQQRDALIDLFTSLWGPLGWTLRHATTRGDVVAAFSSIEIPAHQANLVQLFIRTTTRAVTGADARAAKRAVNAGWKKTADFETALRPLAERVRQTQYALQHGVSEDQKSVVLAQHRRRLDAYAPLRAQADDHDKQLDGLRLAQTDSEAAYAHDELLSLLKRRKYKWNPRNLAHALAGLPQIGWEQSFKRCAKQKSRLWPSRTYRVFEMIAKCADESPDRFRSALGDAIRVLPNKKPEDAAFKQSLCANWRYFRMAIEEAAAFDDEPQRRPYRTFEAYRRLSAQGRDVNEQLMASIEELSDPAAPTASI